MKDYNKEMFAKNLKKHMIEKEVDRYKLCEDLGFKYSTVSEWLSAKKLPRMNKIEQLADYFNITPAYLMGWDTPRYGKRLIEARKANRKDQKELAEETGISVSKLAKFESDVAEPTMEELTLIAQAYGLPLSEFLWKDFGEKTHIISNASLLPADKIRMIPIYESVSAGFGAYADNYITGYTPCYIVNDEEARNTLCITVQGDSMYPKIENGDLVQVLRQDWAENGQIAVVLIDGESGLVKKFEADKDAITLISINPEYPPKVFEGVERTRVRVLGVVKKIIKSV